MHEPSRQQEAAAEAMAAKYGRAGVERFPDSTNVVVRGLVEGDARAVETILVTEDGCEEVPFRAAKLYPGVFGVYQGALLIPDSQTVSLVAASDAARELNGSFE